MNPDLRSRGIRRAIHIALAVCLGVYLYSPLGGVSVVEVGVRVVVFPGLVASGLLLWHGGRFRRWIRRRRAGSEHR